MKLRLKKCADKENMDAYDCLVGKQMCSPVNYTRLDILGHYRIVFLFSVYFLNMNMNTRQTQPKHLAQAPMQSDRSTRDNEAKSWDLPQHIRLLCALCILNNEPRHFFLKLQ